MLLLIGFWILLLAACGNCTKMIGVLDSFFFVLYVYHGVLDLETPSHQADLYGEV